MSLRSYAEAVRYDDADDGNDEKSNQALDCTYY